MYVCVSVLHAAVATGAVLPVQVPRRRTADPSRRQKIIQEKTSPIERDGGGANERQNSRRTVSHAPSRPRSRHEPGPTRRGRRRERDSYLEEEEDERPNISAPDNAESKNLKYRSFNDSCSQRGLDRYILAPDPAPGRAE